MRKIAVFSGKRGGFGALISLMRLINSDSKMSLDLIVTDMHLSNFFGYTANEVKKFFKISARIKLNQINDSGLSRSIALGECVIQSTKVLNKLRPDILVLLGDRGEVLSAAIAALELNIPIAHILGGDLAGNRDGNRIHAISKLSHIHFPSSQDSYNRLIHLGEEKWRVKNFGYSAMDYVLQKNYATKIQIEKKFNFKINCPIILFTQHPVPLESEKLNFNFKKIIKAIKRLTKLNIKIIIT